MGFATSVYTHGLNRLAFGILDNKQSFPYGKTAVYVARGPNDKAEGPFAAPADSLVVDKAFRSEKSAEVGSAIAAIYSTTIPLQRPGRHAVLAVTRIGSKLVGASAGIDVRRRTPIPRPGARAPDVATDTLASAGGDIEKIDTQIPPDDMHQVSFHEVLGKKPVALLFATPQLCVSRVCGPVVDIASQLKKRFGDRVEFIHEEVYVRNDATKGYRPSLRAFGLRTEPWLFTVDRRGRVAARLEGSFGINEFRRAIEAALD
jgi:hypothetical protein